MEGANEYYASMPQVLAKTGEAVAELMNAEAGRVTVGASAGITLAVAGCMTMCDGPSIEQLPDTPGLKNEVLIQRAHRYKYDRMVRNSGGLLIEVGDDTGTTLAQSAGSGVPTWLCSAPSILLGLTQVGLSMVARKASGRVRVCQRIMSMSSAGLPTSSVGNFSS
jgi:L-seryl-tRNA(Ser) seleniumtransferase